MLILGGGGLGQFRKKMRNAMKEVLKATTISSIRALSVSAKT